MLLIIFMFMFMFVFLALLLLLFNKTALFRCYDYSYLKNFTETTRNPLHTVRMPHNKHSQLHLKIYKYVMIERLGEP